jgi:hypothetical protein
MDTNSELVSIEDALLTTRGGTWDLVHIEVRCPNFPDLVSRVSELLVVVLRHVVLHTSSDSDYDENLDFDIDLQYWLTILPSWFTSVTPAQGEGWTIKSWLYWFLSEHEERDWYWVGSKPHPIGSGQIDLRVRELPIRWGALKWSLTCAGANYVELAD